MLRKQKSVQGLEYHRNTFFENFHKGNIISEHSFIFNPINEYLFIKMKRNYI